MLCGPSKAFVGIRSEVVFGPGEERRARRLFEADGAPEGPPQARKGTELSARAPLRPNLLALGRTDTGRPGDAAADAEAAASPVASAAVYATLPLAWPPPSPPPPPHFPAILWPLCGPRTVRVVSVVSRVVAGVFELTLVIFESGVVLSRGVYVDTAAIVTRKGLNGAWGRQNGNYGGYKP